MLKNMMGLPGVSPLGRDAQKQIKGGSEALLPGGGSGTCAILLPAGWGQGTGATTFVSISGDHEYNINGAFVYVGISKATITQLINAGGGQGVHWCCASCASATWIPR
jgi:hypothetical protein